MAEIFSNYFGWYLLPLFILIIFLVYLGIAYFHYKKNIDMTHMVSITIFLFYLFLITYNSYLIGNKNDLYSYILKLIPLLFIINIIYAGRSYNINKDKQDFEYFKDSIQLLEKRISNKLIIERIHNDENFKLTIENDIKTLKTEIEEFNKITFSRNKRKILDIYTQRVLDIEFEFDNSK